VFTALTSYFVPATLPFGNPALVHQLPAYSFHRDVGTVEFLLLSLASNNSVLIAYIITGSCGMEIDEKLLPHLSPLGWEHINLTGDYIWRQNELVENGKLRSLPTLEVQPNLV
jgi:hypothetical protein